MWNTTTLTPPPINSFHAKSISIDLNAVTCILNNGIKSLNDKIYNALYIESLLLSRCVYRMKLQFRSDKGFKFMEKTNTLLKKFLLFDLISDIKSFKKSVPKIYEKDLYLPTKQMLEYVLVRIQGYVQLLKRIGESAVRTAELMNNRLSLGHLWTTAIVVLGLSSRVWKICKYFTKKCCLIYDDLLPLRNKLEIVGVKWLEDNYEFPSNLTDWLDVDWLYEKTDIVSNFQIDLPSFNLLDDSDDEDVQYCYQYNLNDCIVVDDDNILEDNDVKWVETFKNKQNVKYIVDDSDSNSVEIKDAEIKENVEMGGDISDNSGIISIKSDLENSVQNQIHLDSTLEIIDVSSVVEDDDIGESVSREIVNITGNLSGTSKRKAKKNKKINRNLVVAQEDYQCNKPSQRKKKNKNKGYRLKPDSKIIKKKFKNRHSNFNINRRQN